MSERGLSWANIFEFANPKRFMDVSGWIIPWLAALTAVLIGTGLFLAFRVPPDYQQGDTVKIMFIHVPAALPPMRL